MKLTAEQRARLTILLGTSEADHTEVTTAELNHLTLLATSSGEMEAIQGEAAEAAKDASTANETSKPGILDNAKAMVSSNAQLVASNRQLTASAGQLRADNARLTTELATATTELETQRTAAAELQSALDQSVAQNTTTQQSVTDELAAAGVPETGLPAKEKQGAGGTPKTRSQLEEDLKACSTQEERSAMLRAFKNQSSN